MELQRHDRRLENGLRLVAEVDASAESAAVGFFVRTGTRDEPAPLMGVSHFLEHMLFKGTDRLSAEDLNSGFDALGAKSNAFTSHELTCYYARVLPEMLEPAADLLAQMMRPALRPQDLETERGVILEEIAMYEDQPFWVLYEAVADRHYRGQTLGFRVLGTADTIRALPRDAMAGYFDARYAPDVITVALAGRVDFDRLTDLVRERTGSWRPSGATRDSGLGPTGAGRFEIARSNITRGYVLGVSDGPGMDEPMRYAHGIGAHILGSGDNSRLHWALVETGIAEEASASSEPRDGSGITMLYASGDADDLDRIESIMAEEIERLPRSIESEDLQRVKAKVATAVTVGSERPGDRMFRLGRLASLTGRTDTLESELERILAVRVEDVQGALKRWPITPTTMGRLVPGA